MKKILICSDSHGAKSNIDILINDYKYDYFIYLGDGLEDLKHYEYLPELHKVRGNCDFFSAEKDKETFFIDNFKFLITHGNEFKVKRGLGALINFAKEINADFVLYGHTHNYDIQEIDGMTFINPGSLYSGRALLLELSENEKKFTPIKLG